MYKIFSLSDRCEIELQEGDQAAAIEALKVHNNTPGLLAWGAFHHEAGIWLYFQQPDSHLTRRLLVMGSELNAPPEPEPAEAVAAEAVGHGAKFARRIRDIDTSPRAVTAGKSGAEVEDILATFGAHLKPQTKTVLAAIAGIAREKESDEAELARAEVDPDDLVDAAPPGAKHMRNRQVISDRDEAERRRQGAIDMAAWLNTNPAGCAAKLDTAELGALLLDDDVMALVSDSAAATLTELFRLRQLLEGEREDRNAEAAAANAPAAPQIPAPDAKVTVPEGGDAAPPAKKASRDKK